MTPRDLLPGASPETTGVSVLGIVGSLEREKAVEASWRAWYAKRPRAVADPCPSPDAPLNADGIRVHYWDVDPPPHEWGVCRNCKEVRLHRGPERSKQENLQPFNNSKKKTDLSSPKDRAMAALAAIPRGETMLIDHSDGPCKRQERRPGNYTCVLYGYVTLSNKRHVLKGKLSVVQHLGPGMAEVRRERV